MTIQYTITEGNGSTSILVAGSFVRVVASTSPRFDTLRTYLESTPDGEHDEAHVLQLLDVGEIAVNKLTQLSERVTYQDSKLYFDGDEIENGLAKHIIRMIENGDTNYEGYVNFLENVAQNPGKKKSKRAVFEWIKDRNLTITTDGHFLAYKGITMNNTSISHGVAWVDGVRHEGAIPNHVGSVVTMPRLDVNSNRNVTCSEGLHAGTYRYASNFGQKTVLVKINPRDVVMVPSDSDGEKLRVCRYEILEDNDHELSETTYDGRHGVESDAEASEESDVDLCPECGEETENGSGQACDECDTTDDYICDCGCNDEDDDLYN